jgi:large subunit ribosomal protein L4
VQVEVYRKGKIESTQVDSTVFGERVLYRTLKDAVVMHQANQRQGTVKTKDRSEVAGSSKKPWKQKHTGRARAGSKRSPLWRKGGRIFGPLPRDYSYHMPKTARRVALRTALLGKLRDGELALVELETPEVPSAKIARQVLSSFGSPTRALLVLAERNATLWKSFRNFPGVCVRTADELCAFDVVLAQRVLVQPEGLRKLVSRVGLPQDQDGVANGGDKGRGDR